MSGALDPRALEEATRAQLSGSDPTASAWVSASAGSGKTKVLRDRVLRLLLAGIEPSRILCLTFTKAAAAEMSNRISGTLAKWAAIPNHDLRAELRDLAGGKDIAALMPVARRLFARVLDTPGGMKIQTIHAFCQSLLRRFPLEADVAPHFGLIEERDAAALMREARDEMLNAARLEPGGALRAALDLAVARMNEGKLNDLLGALLNRRARFQRLIERSAAPDAVRRALRNLLRVGLNDTRETILAAAVTDLACDAQRLRRVAEALTHGTEKNQAAAGALVAWLNCTAEGRAGRFDDYCGIFLRKTDGEPRKNPGTKGALKFWAGVNEAMASEAARLIEICARLRAVEIATGTEALLRLGRDVLERYEARKDAAARLDYEDLILKSVDLLQRPGIAPWVLYKLDGGLDHVLIDEAQDTNPEQWRVIAALTAEFFAGQGAVDYPRTLFAVGDRKQSIYSFQGAAPEEFGRHETLYGEWTQGRLRSVALNVSFRSTAAVLSLVDRVFSASARAGVLPAGDTLEHRVSRVGDFGEITAWPVACPVDEDVPAPWSLPRVRELTAAPESRVAEAIAAEIALLLASGTTGRLGQARRLGPGDVMILVRNRTGFVELMVRALKRRNIPVAGIDRMQLLQQIAVQDIMAFADFLLLPEDDLNLAALLRSPLVGLSEDELFELCIDRNHQSLWSRIGALVHESLAARRAHDLLQPYLDSLGFATPFELLARLLDGEGGRRRLYQRLGEECGEAVDEFLNLALAFEASHAPDLQAMLRWMRAGELTVKRDLEEGGGRVRIITVHGAKGLEAPVVFLADQRRREKPPLGLFWRDLGGTDLPIWSPNKAADDPVTEAAREAELDRQRAEENRLLYVAMTRAEERLYVCGWKGTQAVNTPSWHDHIHAALAEMTGVAKLPRPAHLGGPAEGWDGEMLRLTTGAPPVPAARAVTRAPVEMPPPAWLGIAAPALADPPKPLTPSRPAEPEPAALSPLGADEGWRYQRGRVVHHLLEMLPQLAAEARLAAAMDYLARPSSAVAEEQRQALAEEVVAVIAQPDFAAIFGPGSRAEVPIVATLRQPDGRTQVLSGQIDRLVVRESDVWVVDFKSNRPAPMLAAHVSQQYLGQLAAYRRALASLYANKEIRCFLLWTDGPRLMEIPPAMLAAHGTNPTP
ncbi:MAG: double-strand break repair helicase AddA [Rhodospirillaceae bacterium]|nr:double-strand break repair helicase AddA [Rhodospirillaceae bacterium]